MAKKKPQAEPVEPVVSIEDMVEALEEAAQALCSEAGECWGLLANLERYITYAVSEEFRVAWEKEIKSQYDQFRNEYEWIEKDVTQTHKVRELRCKND